MKTDTDIEKRVWFLDFESNKKGEIFIAGILNSGVFRQVVLDYRLSGLAEHRSLKIFKPINFIDNLLEKINELDGVISAYGTIEKDLIEQVLMENQRATPTYQYCNLHRAAKRWVNRHMKNEFNKLPPLKKTADKYLAKHHPRSLASIMRLLESPAPPDYAIDKTTKRINAVISGLNAKKGIYTKLTTTQKRQATQLLKHNEFDVLSLPKLMDEIASTDLSLFSKSGWSPPRI